MKRRYTLVVTGLLLLLASCSADGEKLPDGSFAVVVNTDVAVGENRLLIGLLGPDGTRLGSPDLPIRVEAIPPRDDLATRETDGRFMWIIENASGLYRANLDLASQGPWEIRVTPDGGDALPSIDIFVPLGSQVPWVGEPAPAPDTPTLSNTPVEALTTDPEPDERFYETSLADAIHDGKRTVLVFSTPAFCQTEACGPLLDIVKSVAVGHPDTTFIHVEVFEGFTEPGFAPDLAHLAPSAGSSYWNLPSEPWVFVIDEAGLVEARFEGVMEAAELEAILG